MSQPTPHYEPGEQQPTQAYQQGYYASLQARPQYEGQPQPDPPVAGYGQQSHPTQPQYGQPHYPPQAGYRRQPVPPTRSRNGLVIGLLVGAVALVLVCGGVSYFVIRSITNEPATPLAQASTPPSHSPSKAPTLTTPARTAEAFAQTPLPAPQIYSNTLEVERFRLQVEISPARTGDNVVYLQAFTTSGQPQKVQEWKVTASQPGAGTDQVNVPILKLTDNHAVGMISLPAPGLWQFQFTLRTSDIHQDSVNAEVPIR